MPFRTDVVIVAGVICRCGTGVVGIFNVSTGSWVVVSLLILPLIVDTASDVLIHELRAITRRHGAAHTRWCLPIALYGAATRFVHCRAWPTCPRVQRQGMWSLRTACNGRWIAARWTHRTPPDANSDAHLREHR